MDRSGAAFRVHHHEQVWISFMLIPNMYFRRSITLLSSISYLSPFVYFCRVEGAHSTFKDFLRPGPMALDTVFGNMHDVLEIQFTQIMTSFGESKLRSMSCEASAVVFRLLDRVVSHKALTLLLEELKFAETHGVVYEDCEGDILVTMGLPCTHVIALCYTEGVHYIHCTCIISGGNSIWRRRMMRLM